MQVEFQPKCPFFAVHVQEECENGPFSMRGYRCGYILMSVNSTFKLWTATFDGKICAMYIRQAAINIGLCILNVWSPPKSIVRIYSNRYPVFIKGEPAFSLHRVQCTQYFLLSLFLWARNTYTFRTNVPLPIRFGRHIDRIRPFLVHESDMQPRQRDCLHRSLSTVQHMNAKFYPFIAVWRSRLIPWHYRRVCKRKVNSHVVHFYCMQLYDL